MHDHKHRLILIFPLDDLHAHLRCIKTGKDFKLLFKNLDENIYEKKHVRIDPSADGDENIHIVHDMSAFGRNRVTIPYSRVIRKIFDNGAS
jgi:hypothetical protein